MRLTVKSTLLGVAASALLGSQSVVAQGVPVNAPQSIAQYLEQFVMYLADKTLQEHTTDALNKKETVNADLLGVKSEQLAAINGPRAVQSELSATSPYAQNPMAADTSVDASRLFGYPRASLESKIVATAMQFKNSPGVLRAGLDPLTWRILFQSLVKQESGFDPSAKSPAGAYGLTQLMPGTASDLGVNRLVVEENLRGGAKYITKQLQDFGTIDFALAAYNAGPGNVRKYGGVPPFKETQGYVVRIKGFMREYIAKYGGNLPDASFAEGLMSNGEYGYVAAALSSYAEYSLIEANKSVARLEEIKAKIDGSPDLQYSKSLNVSAVMEVQKLQVILIRLRTAAAEAEASFAVASAQMAAEGNFYLDWTYKK